MKKKMCIRVSLNCDKCRRKAMEVAVGAQGVISVALEGELEDELVVVGEGVDAAGLVNALRKKACYAILETLEEVKPDDILLADDDQMTPQEDKDTDMFNNIEPADDDNCTNQTTPPHCCLAQHPTFCYEQPAPEMYQVVYESYGPRCTIM